MLDLEFMRLAFAAGAIVGVLAPTVGFFLVQRELSLIGDGIGHVAFAGVAAGYLLGVSPVWTALVACSRPSTSRSSVVFPPPFGPAIATNSPRSTVRSTSRSTGGPWPYAKET